ncbi:prepilin-type N-terminal cleavage/methylation domain-containing protein [Anaerobutyricum soehngenii]|uniref:Prepilin-type N-terminal cleavage/methylation domain-containing protein n=2 Tax=Anaerobutyricum soehngenii TaxID=105843 RepID=A0A6N7YC26_9FIRM|nr:prepilin-type N-terminal cleavage/methylation domain-containing protein [Anaerobutyricum soehngenii]
MSMLKFLNKKKNDNKGFSLVELIIVVAIMAILVGLLAPQYLKYVEKSRKSADASNLDEMVRAIQIYAADAEVTLPADTYTITIGKGGTTVEAGTATQKVDNEKVAKDALNENAPDWAKTKLKSNKWTVETNSSNATSVSAEITVAQDGGTTVRYTPSTLADYINKTAK